MPPLLRCQDFARRLRAAVVSIVAELRTPNSERRLPSAALGGVAAAASRVFSVRRVKAEGWARGVVPVDAPWKFADAEGMALYRLPALPPLLLSSEPRANPLTKTLSIFVSPVHNLLGLL